MAGGKETPRQKMIGMMYLFLTAMLALNVSKEVLHSFVQVNDSLSATVENFKEKNNSIYDDFDQQYSMNKTKVEKWYKLANEVREQANEITKYIEELKVEVVKAADGEGAKAIQDGKVVADDIEAKDNLDVGGQVMQIGKKGPELKEKIIEFREFLLENTDPKHTIIRNSLKKNLNTDDPPSKDGMTPSWTAHTFGHMPLVAVVTMLSKVQSDIRNAEADILRHFYGQISAQDFKFNSLEPIVKANSNYILQGQEFKAEVFIAAQDTTQDPTIFVGNVTTNEEGEYEMVGSPDSLPIENGKGIYSPNTNRVGERTWGGLIEMQAPDGSIQKYKFEHDYKVVPPTAIISASANRVFYYGVPNPLEVSVPGLEMNQIQPRATNGTIRRSGKGYTISPTKPGGKITVRLYATIDDKTKKMGERVFSVKQIPPPTPKLKPLGLTSQSVTKGQMQIANGLKADLEGFIMENIKYKIISFTVSTVVAGGFTEDADVQGSRFNNDARQLINKADRGQRITIDNIKAEGPDGVKKLNPMVFKIK